MVLPSYKAICLLFKPNETGDLAEKLLFVSLHITFPCNTKNAVKPASCCPLTFIFDPELSQAKGIYRP